MKRYMRRLVYRDKYEVLNPLMHIFFLISLAFGISFVFLPGFTGANLTVLYIQSEIIVKGIAVSVWGTGLILVTVMNTILLLTRARKLGGLTAAIGFMLWFYAFITYIFAEFWLGVVGAALPNMLFWIWYYMRVKAYHRNPPVQIDK